MKRRNKDARIVRVEIYIHIPIDLSTKQGIVIVVAVLTVNRFHYQNIGHGHFLQFNVIIFIRRPRYEGLTLRRK